MFYLQVVEDEKQCFSRQPLVELYGVRVVGRDLMMEGQRRTRVPHQVLPEGKQVDVNTLLLFHWSHKRFRDRLTCHCRYLILSESEGWGMWVQADSCMACW